MEIFLARQPIFDRNLAVHGYELLSRSSPGNVFTRADGDQATSEVIDNALSAIGIGPLTSGKPAFINVTRRMLVENFVSILPRESIVQEILENVPPDDDVIRACRACKEAGFELALDDFVCKPEIQPLVALADILKVDFRATAEGERAELVRRYAPRGIRMLAEKLETPDEFRQACDLGYSLFQGYFFCAPEVVSRKEIPAYKVNYLRFLREVNRPDVEFADLEAVIKQEVSLSVRLLRYINSAMFGLRHEVDSIRRALTLLGLQNIRRWASLLALLEMSADKPSELVVTSLIRGRFGELIAQDAKRADLSGDLFLTGMLSAIDAILDRPMIEILEEISVPARVREALTTGAGELGRLLMLVLACERGRWDDIPSLLADTGESEDRLPALYRQALEWAEQIFRLGQ